MGGATLWGGLDKHTGIVKDVVGAHACARMHMCARVCMRVYVCASVSVHECVHALFFLHLRKGEGPFSLAAL